jgi:transposase
MICEKMNTERMNEFLAQVSAAHPRTLIIMILDGASSHRSKDLTIPRNIRFVRLPAYAPELNPQENTSGMNSGRRSSPIACSTICLGSCVNLKMPCAVGSRHEATAKYRRLALDY